MNQTIFVPVEGVAGRRCYVGIRVVPKHDIAVVLQRYPEVPDEAIRQVLKQRGLHAAFG